MSSFEPLPTTPARAPGVFVALPIGVVAFPLERRGPPASDEPIVAQVPDLETVRREAYEAGLAAGRAEHPVCELEALQSAIRAVEEVERSLSALQHGYLVDNRAAVVELAFAIAERLLGRTLETNRESIVALLERALPLLGRADGIRVALAPRDLETMQTAEGAALARWVESHGLAVEADPALSIGEARLFAARTRVEVRLGELLRRLREEIDELPDAVEASS